MECSTFPYLSTSAAPRRQREWQEQNLLFLIDLTMNLADQRSRLTAPLMHACIYIQSIKQTGKLETNRQSCIHVLCAACHVCRYLTYIHTYTHTHKTTQFLTNLLAR